jgi:nucleoside-diphosphate-sugar epimerase
MSKRVRCRSCAVDPRYFRSTEVETLLGDPSKAKNKLGWTPKISFDELVAEMMREDLKAAERDELVKKHGYKTMDYPGEITFGPSKSDGSPRKLMDNSRLNALGWQAKTVLEQGLRLAYQDFGLGGYG